MSAAFLWFYAAFWAAAAGLVILVILELIDAT